MGSSVTTGHGVYRNVAAFPLAQHLHAFAAILLALNITHIWHACQPILHPIWGSLLIVLLAGRMTLQRQHAPSMTSAGASSNEPQTFPPKLFESRTTHRRLFPKEHSFAYSYLLVGIPVGWRGSSGSVLSSDAPHSSSRHQQTWFSVHAEDYLERGSHVGGLAGKLTDYLTAQNVVPDSYGSAYLVTAPRFCGFAFNPVSFWFLYDHNKRLSAMILEVNNTFDERRMYFMPRQTTPSMESPRPFRSRWQKDFHVSPFNDRDGSYSLSAVDPCLGSSGTIDNTIVLSSREGKAKIVARIHSVGPSVDPGNLTHFQTIRFVMRWWWVGFMTNPRILREALALWWKNLRVYYRPEVLTSSIGRTESDEEYRLEPFFRATLQEAADKTGVHIDYTPAAGPSRGQRLRLEARYPRSSKPFSIDVKVLTPAFYAELVRAPNFLLTIDRLCLHPEPNLQMLSVSDPATFEICLRDVVKSHPPVASWDRIDQLNRRLRSQRSLVMVALEGLRDVVGGPRIDAPSASSATNFDFGALVRSTCLPKQVAAYERAVLTVLVSDRMTLGSTWLLKRGAQLLWWLALLVGALPVNRLMHDTIRLHQIRARP